MTVLEPDTRDPRVQEVKIDKHIHKDHEEFVGSEVDPHLNYCRLNYGTFELLFV